MGDPASILRNALGIACKLVIGFQGTPNAALALQRGELDAIVTSESQIAILVRSSPLVAVAILNAKQAPLLPGVPSIFKIAPLSLDKSKWLRFRADVADFGRTLVVLTDTPADRVAVLEKAIASVLTDLSVQSEGARTNRPIAYASGADSRRIVESIFARIDPAERASVKSLLLTAY